MHYQLSAVSSPLDNVMFSSQESVRTEPSAGGLLVWLPVPFSVSHVHTHLPQFIFSLSARAMEMTLIGRNNNMALRECRGGGVKERIFRV